MISATTPLVQVQTVAHQFRNQDGQAMQVLENVSFELPQGTFTCLIGPSGCGKSTLLRILGGLIQPQVGQVQFANRKLNSPQRNISIVFQKDNLMPWRTVYWNLVLPLQLAGYSKSERLEKAKYWLEVTELQDFAESYPAQLSGGMAQRVAIARGLITEPDLLLLDEPFGALDALTRENMWQELLRLWTSTQATVLMVTHSIREALLLADNLLVMSQRPGRIIEQLPVPFTRPRDLDLLTQPEFVKLEATVRNMLGR